MLVGFWMLHQTMMSAWLRNPMCSICQWVIAVLSQWILASAILTSVRMYKLHDKERNWEMDSDDAGLMPGLFDEST